MRDNSLISLIVTAFHNLGHRAHVKKIYKEVKRLGYDGGGDDPNKLIRARIYEHSSDSPKFTQKQQDDLFQHVGGKRSGVWELREHRAKAFGRVPDEEVDRDESNDEADYVPQESDRRKPVERQIPERPGQQQFRDALRERYGDRCLVTGCEILAVLEAAHISPYRGEIDNHPANGLLLRADVHTLFDLDLLGIEPERLRVELHPDVVKEYGCFADVRLRCPGKQRPAREALKLRYEQFRRRLMPAKLKMRALSIRQPFAELIMTGDKDIEYRSRPVTLRERVYIYACKSLGPAEDYEEAGFAPAELPLGVLIGTVEIVDCTGDDGDYEWHLANPQRLKKPLPVQAFPQPGFFWPFGK